jgi:hypothetical protein
MSPSNHTEAQIIGALKQVEPGRVVEDVAREQGVSKHTIYAWQANYGGMEVSEGEEVKHSRNQNAGLKKLLAVFPPSAGLCLMLAAGLFGIGRSPAAFGQSVLTQHNDNQRTGANLAETKLTPLAVSQSFVLLYQLEVPGDPAKGLNTIGAQPLYVASVVVNGMSHEVLFVATRQGFIYAFDVSNGGHKAFWDAPLELKDPRGFTAQELQGMDGRYQDDPLWNLDPKKASHCLQTHGPVGIASTPVIEPGNNAMYVVYRTSSPFGPMQYSAPPPGQAGGIKNPYDARFYIRKIDIRTSQKLAEQEIVLPAGHPYSSKFDPNKILTRTGLLLSNDVLYMGFAGAVCDGGAGEPKFGVAAPGKNPTNGWILAIDANTLKVIDGLVTTPNSSLGGIWQSGAGLAADRNGAVYALTGNNQSDHADAAPTLNPATEMSNAVVQVKLVKDAAGTSHLTVQHFTAGNWYRLDTGARFPGDPELAIPCQPVVGCSGDGYAVAGDSDLASGGAVVLPNGLVLGGGKQGRFYLLQPSHMGTAKQSFQAFYNSWHPGISPCDYDEDQSFGPNIHGAPVVWHPDGLTYAFVYHMPEKDYVKAFRAFDDGTMEERPFLSTQDANIRSPRGMPGGALSLSASGGRNGVLWVSVPKQSWVNALNTNGEAPGRLLAFDALTLEKLWEGEDRPFAKYIPPTIGGGKVFRSAYANTIYVYGLLGGLAKGVIKPPIIPARPVTALWRSNDHLELYMTGRQTGGGSVLTTDWESTCEPLRGAPIVSRGWRGWYPVDSKIDTVADDTALPGGYDFMASGSAPVAAVLAPVRTGVPNPHVDLFAADNGGHVMSNYWETPPQALKPDSTGLRWKGTGWHNWFAVNAGSISIAARQPVTAVWRPGSGHLDLFTVDNSGGVMSTYFEKNEWQGSWFPVANGKGITVPGQRVTAVWRNSDHLDLFITGKDGKVMSTYFENDAWQKRWFQVDPGSATAKPGQAVTALWRNANHLDLFLTDTQGRVLSTYFENNGWQPAWFPVNPASGSAQSGQTVTALWRNAGHLDLFIVDNNGRVLSTYFENNRWQPSWFAVRPESGRTTAGQEVFALWAPGNNHLDLFISEPGGRVMSIFFDNNEWAPSWFTI